MQVRDPDLALLIDAAQAAGEIAMRHFQARPEVWEKAGGQGPVTEADLAVDQMLRAELLAARPDYGWLSEETEDDPARLQAEHCFVIDPIDGTRAYIAGEDHWAHSLAITRKGQVVAGVVLLPALGKLYTAALGHGAHFNGEPMRVTSRDQVDGATMLGAKPNFDAVHWPGGLPALQRNFRPSLAYRLALVAQGRFDGMMSFRNTWEWDVAAGALLVTEAGGAVSDQRAAPAIFNNPRPALDGFVGAGQPLHGKLCPLFAPAAP